LSGSEAFSQPLSGLLSQLSHPPLQPMRLSMTHLPPLHWLSGAALSSALQFLKHVPQWSGSFMRSASHPSLGSVLQFWKPASQAVIAHAPWEQPVVA
jgi:hypothetical protein